MSPEGADAMDIAAKPGDGLYELLDTAGVFIACF